MRDDGAGFLAFILGGVVVVVLTLALIAYRAQTDRSRHTELGNIRVTMQTQDGARHARAAPPAQPVSIRQ
jgi:hypothetical protein